MLVVATTMVLRYATLQIGIPALWRTYSSGPKFLDDPRVVSLAKSGKRCASMALAAGNFKGGMCLLHFSKIAFAQARTG